METIDLRNSDTNQVAQQIVQAAHSCGFFFVRNHDIPEDLIARVFDDVSISVENPHTMTI
jgi:isopenicillin N synthase-like dioxygenase